MHTLTVLVIAVS